MFIDPRFSPTVAKMRDELRQAIDTARRLRIDRFWIAVWIEGESLSLRWEKYRIDALAHLADKVRPEEWEELCLSGRVSRDNFIAEIGYWEEKNVPRPR